MIAREKKAREQETRAKRVREFRQLHRDGIFIIPNPWDAGSAKILASMGYKALATTSAGYSYSRGVPDSTLTLQQTLVNCREIVAATTLPVSADLENGYGPSPEQVKETVRAAAEAGLAGGSIEDASGDPDSPIYDLEHACERISAAVEARAGLEGDFVLTARAENYLYGKPDIDDTIARLKRFEEAGADVLYAPGLRILENIKQVCDSVTAPVNVVMGLPGAAFSVSELEEAGVRRISVGSALYRHAMSAFFRAAEEIQGSGTFGFSENSLSFRPFEQVFEEPQEQ